MLKTFPCLALVSVAVFGTSSVRVIRFSLESCSNFFPHLFIASRAQAKVLGSICRRKKHGKFAVNENLIFPKGFSAIDNVDFAGEIR